MRFRSLDIFRGATVALMILVNNPGSWNHLYGPLAHAPWHGCTPTDLVFPFFLFAVGNALAFVLPGLRKGPQAAFWLKVARRSLLIFAIGLLVLNAAPYVRWSAEGALVLRDWETLRLMGVLQRIALCFFFAAAIVWLFGDRAAWWGAGGLLVGYWALCVLLAAPGADPYSLQGWFGSAIDRALLGESHLYKGEGVPFDPEGLASTLPAIAQVLLGYAAGRLVQASRADAALVARLFLWATALLVLGYLWQLAMPLNKKIWTSSYVLHTTGLALMALAALVHLVEIAPRGTAAAAAEPARAPWLWGWARFFEVFGKNPLFVFVLSGFVPRVLSLVRWEDGLKPDGSTAWISPLPWAYRTFFAPIGDAAGDPRLGSLAYACANLALYAALAFWLDRRRIYIRV